MRIGINASSLKNAHSGIANYLLNLVLNLKKVDQRNEYVLFFGSEKNVPGQIAGAGVECNISKMPTTNQALKILWAHFMLPLKLKRMKIDLFHEPASAAPLFNSCNTVVTVHDIAYERIPHCYRFRDRAYFRALSKKGLERANRIIAVSHSTKNDIVDRYSISPGKIRVIYEGIDEIYRRLHDKERCKNIRKFYKIDRDFILYVSGITPRKNLVRLIKAFKILKDRKEIDSLLVFVGEKAWWSEEVFEEVKSSGMENDVIFCGYVPKEHLLCLYSEASVFVFPSLYEGFGLPVLEAMACGCPVVASNTSSLPEICGGAGLLFDPLDVEGLSDAIYRVITDSSLRQDLIEKGIERTRAFSWRRSAEETLAVYSEAVS